MFALNLLCVVDFLSRFCNGGLQEGNADVCLGKIYGGGKVPKQQVYHELYSFAENKRLVFLREQRILLNPFQIIVYLNFFI